MPLHKVSSLSSSKPKLSSNLVQSRECTTPRAKTPYPVCPLPPIIGDPTSPHSIQCGTDVLLNFIFTRALTLSQDLRSGVRTGKQCARSRGTAIDRYASQQNIPQETQNGFGKFPLVPTGDAIRLNPRGAALPSRFHCRRTSNSKLLC